MIFPQGMVTTTVLPSADTIFNLQQMSVRKGPQFRTNREGVLVFKLLDFIYSMVQKNVNTDFIFESHLATLRETMFHFWS